MDQPFYPTDMTTCMDWTPYPTFLQPPHRQSAFYPQHQPRSLTNLIFTLLPRELRDEIWTLAYGTNLNIQVKPSVYLVPGHFFPPSTSITPFSGLIRSLAVCRQWYHETLHGANWGFPNREVLDEFVQHASPHVLLNIRSVTLLTLGPIWANATLLDYLPNLRHLTLTLSVSGYQRVCEGKEAWGLEYLVELTGLESFKVDMPSGLAGVIQHNLGKLNRYQQELALQEKRRFEENVRRRVTRPRCENSRHVLGEDKCWCFAMGVGWGWFWERGWAGGDGATFGRRVRTCCGIEVPASVSTEAQVGEGFWFQGKSHSLLTDE